MADTLQQQGVPIQSGLRGPNAPRQTSAPRGPAKTPRTQRNRVRKGSSRRSGNVANAQQYGPTRLAEKSSAGVGLLEAEFFGIVFLLILALFTSSASYGDKIMSFMKRGTLTAILFFFLALIAAIGPNAAKVAKGLGALVLVMILVSTPGQDIITSLDNFFKANWTGTSESASTSSDSGTNQSTTGAVSSATSGSQSLIQGIEKVLLEPGFGLSKALGSVSDINSIASKILGVFHL